MNGSHRWEKIRVKDSILKEAIKETLLIRITGGTMVGPIKKSTGMKLESVEGSHIDRLTSWQTHQDIHDPAIPERQRRAQIADDLLDLINSDTENVFALVHHTIQNSGHLTYLRGNPNHDMSRARMLSEAMALNPSFFQHEVPDHIESGHANSRTKSQLLAKANALKTMMDSQLRNGSHHFAQAIANDITNPRGSLLVETILRHADPEHETTHKVVIGKPAELGAAMRKVLEQDANTHIILEHIRALPQKADAEGGH